MSRHHSSSTTFLQQLVAQRTAFVQVKQEELTDDDLATAKPNDCSNDNDEYHDPDGHLCVVCMDNERSCLYVPCNHLAVCAECGADIMHGGVCAVSDVQRGDRPGGGVVGAVVVT